MSEVPGALHEGTEDSRGGILLPWRAGGSTGMRRELCKWSLKLMSHDLTRQGNPKDATVKFNFEELQGKCVHYCGACGATSRCGVC